MPNLVAVVLVNFVVFNVLLAVFNLIPVPPLDGSTLLFRFLPLQTAWRIRPMLAQYGMFVVFAVVAPRRQPAFERGLRSRFCAHGLQLKPASSGRTCGPA